MPDGVLPLTGGFPNPSTFATDVLGDIAARVLRDEPGLALQYTPVEGIPSVREYLAERQEAQQGVRPEALMVTSGGMECLALACSALLDPGDAIAVEGPTYLGALMAFRGAEAEVHEIPMDEDGLVVDALAERLEDGLRPKLALRHPRVPEPDRPHAAARAPRGARRALPPPRRADPRGRRLPRAGLGRRAAADAVVARARRRSCRRARSPRSSSRACGSAGRAGPEEVVAQLAAAKANTDQCAGALGQRMVEEYGRGGHFERQLPARARALRAPTGARSTARCATHMPEGVAWTEPAGGFLTWVRLPDGLDAMALREAALDAGVAYVPGAPFYARDRAPASCGSRSARSARTTSPRRAAARLRDPRRAVAGNVNGGWVGEAREPPAAPAPNASVEFSVSA